MTSDIVKKYGSFTPSFTFIFTLFTIEYQKYQFQLYKLTKRERYAWELNPRQQDGSERWIPLPMVAPYIRPCLRSILLQGSWISAHKSLSFYLPRKWCTIRFESMIDVLLVSQLHDRDINLWPKGTHNGNHCTIMPSKFTAILLEIYSSASLLLLLLRLVVLNRSNKIEFFEATFQHFAALNFHF